MCEQVLQKQAVLESVLSEKAAVEARLEGEMARCRELQAQVSVLLFCMFVYYVYVIIPACM